jgi:hypothetical protein
VGRLMHSASEVASCARAGDTGMVSRSAASEVEGRVGRYAPRRPSQLERHRFNVEVRATLWSCGMPMEGRVRPSQGTLVPHGIASLPQSAQRRIESTFA